MDDQHSNWKPPITALGTRTIAISNSRMGPDFPAYSLRIRDGNVPNVEQQTYSQSIKETIMMTLSIPLMFAAIEYSLIYMLLGGGFFGAIVIFFVAKMLGK